MNKRVLLITNIPNPYRIPLFNELNDQLNEKNDKLYVAFAGTGYARRKWNNKIEQARFEYTILRSRKITLGSDEKILFTYGGIFAQIKKVAPDVIIVAGFSIATLKLYIYSFFKNIRFIIWSGSINTKGRQDTLLRKFYRTIIVKRAYGFIAYGSIAKKYLIDLGAEPDKISIAINTVDTEFFLNNTNRNNYLNTRKENFTLLYVGHFTKGKHINKLIEIVYKLSQEFPKIKLLLVGEGPEKNNLVQLSKTLGIENQILFTGFKQKEELPKYFNNADVFLFPSEYDIWGLVLVEAMASAIPCLASIYSGAAGDIIKNDVNGYLADFNDINRAIDIIRTLLINKELNQVIGVNAQNFIKNNVTIKHSTSGFKEALYRS